ncbi:hypothetical protein NJD71_11320 [Psychrobacter sp. PP-21]|nr:hypothetical protein [Psychrobacter sp. PP-21]MDX2374714.1 hypothetical protein [Psychrobacter sp. PP-21]
MSVNYTLTQAIIIADAYQAMIVKRCANQKTNDIIMLYYLLGTEARLGND